MSDKPEPTAEEKMADALPANAKYVAAHQNSRGVYWEGRIFVSVVFALTRLACDADHTRATGRPVDLA